MGMRRVIQAIWPPAKRRYKEEAERAAIAAAEAAEAARQAAEEQREEEAKRLRLVAYQFHLDSVDLKGIGTKHGVPLRRHELFAEVRERRRLASAAKLPDELQIGESQWGADWRNMTKALDETALLWILESGDPDRQRDAAKALLDARANLSPVPSLRSYAWAVAMAAAEARFLEDGGKRAQLVPRRALDSETVTHPLVAFYVVSARANLLRSLDPRWARTRNGARKILSDKPF